MNAQAQMEARKLEAFRPYLRMVARLHWDARLRGKLDPEDLVQQTLLEAHRSLGQFRGETDAELAGWLTQILAHQLAHAVRYYTQAMRDLGQEVPLEDGRDGAARHFLPQGDRVHDSLSKDTPNRRPIERNQRVMPV